MNLTYSSSIFCVSSSILLDFASSSASIVSISFSNSAIAGMAIDFK